MMDIARLILERFAVMLPRWAIDRIFDAPKNIHIEFSSSKDNILSDLNRHGPSQVPFLRLDFKITNFNPFDITLERMVFEVWFGQPTLHNAILKRYVIPARQPALTVSFRCAVTETQKQQVEYFLSNDGGGQMIIDYTAYFETKARLVEIKNQIVRDRL